MKLRVHFGSSKFDKSLFIIKLIYLFIMNLRNSNQQIQGKKIKNNYRKIAGMCCWNNFHKD